LKNFLITIVIFILAAGPVCGATAEDPYWEQVRSQAQEKEGAAAPGDIWSGDRYDPPSLTESEQSRRTREKLWRRADELRDERARRIQEYGSDIEILKPAAIRERDLTSKYQRKFRNHQQANNLTAPIHEPRPLDPQAMLDRHASMQARQPDSERLNRSPLESRNLIHKYNKIGTPNPSNYKDLDLYNRRPLEDRNLIRKYNEMGTYNPANRNDVKLQDRDPLEDRNLIEKYNRTGETEPENWDDPRIVDRDPLEDRNLIEKYNKIGTINPANRNDSRLLDRNPLEDRDLLEKYDRIE